MHQRTTSNNSNKTTINRLKYYISIDFSKIGLAEVLYMLIMGIAANNVFMLFHFYKNLSSWLLIITIILIILAIILFFNYKSLLNWDGQTSQLERKRFLKFGSIVFIISVINGIYIHYVVWDVLKLLYN